MTRPLRRFIPLLLVLPLAACPPNPFGGTVCTTEARPGIVVEVLDAATGASAAAGATLIARDGAFADTVSVSADHQRIRSVGLAYERPGVYTVLVRKEGYREWVREGVRVRENECHVRTVHLEARLEPLPGE